MMEFVSIILWFVLADCSSPKHCMAKSYYISGFTTLQLALDTAIQSVSLMVSLYYYVTALKELFDTVESHDILSSARDIIFTVRYNLVFCIVVYLFCLHLYLFGTR